MPQPSDAHPSGPIKVLLIEDNPVDSILIKEMLEIAGAGLFVMECADRLSMGLERLKGNDVDVVLLDLTLPDSEGLETCIRAHMHAPGVPIIVLTGLDDHDIAIRSLQEGAQDYLVKGQVDSTLLARSLRYAIEREKLVRRLHEAIDQIKTLRGLLPICAACKKIRDDQGYWTQIEDYLARHSDAEFSHGLCPECAREIYPEAYRERHPEEDED
ncbi:response regulator [Dissulfurirhabdus thermomarina]|uniref:Response regulator n=1 Tax=Dissulfurirhabdus thermomarina TaxID=1765737 RepID=A0A6N9TT05_DISTH|nr:response regulator [Dissulfurirhabdus thermomarina]NDY41666.1 response regulator [Dissulfurirhabdus thermomarina]NMX24358.1 response regulator [Dissulfurirhabdus thermomarina]